MRDLLHGHLAQLIQVRKLEKVIERRLNALGRVHLARFQPLAQVFGRDVDIHQLIRRAHHVVRNALLDPDAGRLLHDVVKAFHVLDIQRRNHVDPGAQQLVDVLVSFGVATPRRVGMRQLVDQRNGGVAGQQGVDVQLFERDAMVLNAAARHHLEIADLCQRLRATVRLHNSDDDVNSLTLQTLPFQQHLIRLAYTRCEPEIDLQAPRC